MTERAMSEEDSSWIWIPLSYIAMPYYGGITEGTVGGHFSK